MRFALDERVLNSVAAYLGKAPFLESIELLYSRPSTQALESSQLWHEDMTEESLVKLFVYVTDVDDRCGPFTLIPRGPSRSVPRHLPHYVDDDTMRRYVGDNQHTMIEGSIGHRVLRRYAELLPPRQPLRRSAAGAGLLLHVRLRILRAASLLAVPTGQSIDDPAVGARPRVS